MTAPTIASAAIASLIAGILLIPQAFAANLFIDDFEDGNAIGWTTQNGAWEVVQDGGSYVYQQTSTSEGRASAGNSAWTDYSVEAKVNVSNWNGSNRAYVAGRYKDGNNFYAASLYNSNGGKLEIRKKVSGSTTTLATKDFSLATGTWYNVKLEMTGSTIRMYVNGSLELSATDSSLTSGAIGLIAYKTAAKFDQVVVSDTSGSPSPTPTATPTPSPSTSPTPTPTPTPAAGEVYVAPNGTDSNPGTLASPTTLTAALTKVAPGGIIYLRGGTYAYSTQITIDRTNNGTASAKKQIAPYASEKPILDFSSQTYNASDVSLNARGLQVNGSNWTIKGLEIKGAADNGIYVAGNANRLENLDVHHNRDTGVQLGRYASTAADSEWPSNNEIINTYSHDNFDPDNGEDADGFAAKLTVGTGNVFDGCIAAYNTDDGWDLYTKTETGPIGTVTIRNSVAHHNGQTSSGSTTSNSDGNGYKLGGEKIAVNHVVTNSVAYQNKKHGFTYNSNPGTITLKNNTSYNNGQSNFAFDLGTHQFTNNLSYKGSSSDKTSGTDVQSTNVWWKNNVSTNASGLLASDADFVSLTPTLTRNADGSPNLGNFLKLATGSDLIGAGTPSGTNIGRVEP
ncbi:right-handed parallel beta-helix repeat-containing protein [Paenibacillus sp. WST5]|uniref:Right-handed parallel beta-helix repeat-containing protein n=1 Tax=Paenibacillus sedimenti TaxID=2770274 RepID=A0A926QJM1_9BACL|nr:right-handed parallel beta-helix repeat-containing protein [Paenibacillus sedimenti]